MQREEISVPALGSRDERRQYLDDICSRRRVFPWMNGGMGVDFSNETLAAAVMEEGGIGTLAASAVGFNAAREEILAERGFEARVAKYHAANKRRITEEIAAVRARVPNGVLATNLMAAMSDFEPMVDAIGSSGDVDLLMVGAGLPRGLARQMEQFPHMRYAPIISSDRAAKIMQRSAEGTSRPPDAFYVELPQYAGGHLGAKDAEDALDAAKFDAAKLHDEIRTVAPDTPLILAGGIAYGEDIERAYAIGYDGVSLGTRLLLTQESGLPDEIIIQYYLDHRYRIVTAMTSPAGLPSRYVEGPVNVEDFMASVRRDCVSCIGHQRCKFNKPGGEETSYCIARRLPMTRRGEHGGVLFTGSRLEEMRDDPLYRDAEGNLKVPTVQRAVERVFSGLNGRSRLAANL